MNVYVDSSVLLRVVFGEPDALTEWSRITSPTCSEVIRIESLRTIDRARIQRRLDDAEVARLRADLMRSIEAFTLIGLNDAVKARAGEPFPTTVGTLDAIHLSSALLAREQVEDLRLATHDQELEIAARSLGFDVLT